MNLIAVLLGTVATGAVAMVGAHHASETLHEATAAVVGTGLVAETNRVGDALATESETARPETLTCVADQADPIDLPCVSFAEWDGVELTGRYRYSLRQDPTLGLVLVGTAADQRVEYVVFGGGLQGSTDTRIPIPAE